MKGLGRWRSVDMDWTGKPGGRQLWPSVPASAKAPGRIGRSGTPVRVLRGFPYMPDLPPALEVLPMDRRNASETRLQGA